MLMNQQDRELNQEEGISSLPASSLAEARFHSPEELEELIDEELRCVQCGTPVKDVVCGHRNPCPFCGFPYPVGDCSDLVEN
jgi:rubrerythrin